MKRKTKLIYRGPQPMAAGEKIVPIRSALVDLGNGTYQLDIAGLPLPSDTYTASCGWAYRDSSWVTFGFGNQKHGQQVLRTRLEVRLPLEAFQAVWKNTASFFEKLKNAIAAHPYLVHPQVPDVASWPTEKDHTVLATICFMLHAGSQAEMDFFELPAPKLVTASIIRDLSGVEVRPIVRVALPTGIMLQMLQACEEIYKGVEGILPP